MADRKARNSTRLQREKRSLAMLLGTDFGGFFAIVVYALFIWFFLVKPRELHDENHGA